MSDFGKIQDRFLDQADKEQSFRKQIVGEITQLLRRKDTPISLKIFIILGLLVLLGISFVFTIFLIHTVFATVKDTTFNPMTYVAIISAQIVLLMAICLPLVIKASNREAAIRLEENLDWTYAAKIGIKDK